MLQGPSQLNHLAERHTIIRMEDVIAVESAEPLPPARRC